MLPRGCTSPRTNSFASIPAETAVRGGCPARAKHNCPYLQKCPYKPTRYQVATRHRPVLAPAVSRRHTLCARRAAPCATLPYPRPPLRTHLGAVERRLPIDQMLPLVLVLHLDKGRARVGRCVVAVLAVSSSVVASSRASSKLTVGTSAKLVAISCPGCPRGVKHRVSRVNCVPPAKLLVGALVASPTNVRRRLGDCSSLGAEDTHLS